MDNSPRRQTIERVAAELRELEGLPEVPAEIDRAGLARMKAALGSSKVITVKEAK